MILRGPWKAESQRAYFAKALIELGRERPDLVVIGADTTHSLKTADFGKEYPGRLYNLGIAEQNMMGVAAGFAAAGKLPFACTYSVFGTAHVYNIIRQSIAYPKLNVKICCSHAGLTVGADGATHQMNEDITLMRALPNMAVVVPADGPETYKAAKAAATHAGPLYMRFSRMDFPTVTEAHDPFVLGQASLVREGSDVTIVANGIMVSRALQAAEALAKSGLEARVLNLHTVKPLDAAALEAAARETGAIVAAEEHTIMGGLGSAVAEAVSELYPVPVARLGVRDRFGESGEGEKLLDKYGLSAVQLIKAAHDVVARKAK